MFGIKIINFCCSGVISCGKPQWLLQEQWLDEALVQNDAHTHTRSKESHPKRNACADSDTLSFTRIPAVCGAQSEVLGAGTGPCRLFVPQSLQGHLKTHSLPRTSLPRRKTATHKGSKLRTTHACVWGYIGVRLCPCHGKKHYGCQYETCVPLWYDVTEEVPCDQRYWLLVNSPGWLGWKI